MGRLVNTAEGGTNGTAVSTGNSGGSSGDAFSSIVLGSGCTFTFTSSSAAQGTKSYEHNVAASTTTYTRWDTGAGSSAYFGSFIQFPTIWTTISEIASFRSSSQSTMGQLVVNTNGRLNLVIAGTTVYSMPSSLNGLVFQAGEWLWVECGINRSTGAWSLRILETDGTVIVNESGTASTLPSADIGTLRFGRPSSSAQSGIVRFDNLIFDTTKSSLEGIPAVAPPDPPVAEVANPDYGWAKLDATGTTAGDGGSLSYSISPATNTNQISTGVFLVPATDTSVTYTITVTESPSGQTDTVTAAVLMPATGGGVERKRWDGMAWV